METGLKNVGKVKWLKRWDSCNDLFCNSNVTLFC